MARWVMKSHFCRPLFVLFSILISAVPICHVHAQNQADLDLDQVLQGFEERPKLHPALKPNLPGNQPTSTPPQIYPKINFSGTFSAHIAYAPYQHTTVAGYQVQGLTSFKPKLNLSLDGQLNENWAFKVSSWAYYDLAYTFNQRDQFSTEVLNNYERELELGEAYLQGRLSNNLDIISGRQVIVWGKADFFRVVDQFNPLDNREPGMTDIKYKRLPLWMTRVSSYVGPWNISAIMSHEFRYDKVTVFGNDFYPYDFPAPLRESVDHSFKNCSFGLTVGRSYPGLDIDFYSGSFLKELDLVGLNRDIPRRRTNRLFLAGMAIEKAMNHWLFKMEAAWLEGLNYYSLPEERKSRLDVLLGLDYTAFLNTRISFEVVNQHLFQYDSDIAEADNTPAVDTLLWALLITRNFQYDKLQLALLSYVGGLTFSQGWAQKISATYKMSDHLSLTAGYLFVHDGDNYLMRNAGKNDRLFFQFDYLF